MAARVRAGAKPTRCRRTSSDGELAGLDSKTAAIWGPIVVLPRARREVVEARGFEPLTPAMRTQCSPIDLHRRLSNVLPQQPPSRASSPCARRRRTPLDRLRTSQITDPNPRSAIDNPQLAIRNPKLAIPNPHPSLIAAHQPLMAFVQFMKWLKPLGSGACSGNTLKALDQPVRYSEHRESALMNPVEPVSLDKSL